MVEYEVILAIGSRRYVYICPRMINVHDIVNYIGFASLASIIA
jgi:hypothetical protein